jgi:protein-S-isoprenylcysteine O-methyltransferase Ste14
MVEKYQIYAFIPITFLLLVFSWRSLAKPRSHGFYRFFAWEFMAALLLLNLKFWFRDPFSWHQVLSWALLLASIVQLLFGVHSLITRGKATRKRAGEPDLLAFEKTTQLVTTGIFKYIRHPMYCSLLLLNWGAFFKSPTWVAMLLAALAALCLFLTARADENECVYYFGEKYHIYMRLTKRFIPFLF